MVGSTSSPPAAHNLLLSGSRLAVRDLLEGAGLLDGQVSRACDRNPSRNPNITRTDKTDSRPSSSPSPGPDCNLKPCPCREAIPVTMCCRGLGSQLCFDAVWSPLAHRQMVDNEDMKASSCDTYGRYRRATQAQFRIRPKHADCSALQHRCHGESDRN